MTVRRTIQKRRAVLKLIGMGLFLAGCTWLALTAKSHGWLEEEFIAELLAPLGWTVYPTYFVLAAIAIPLWLPLSGIVLAGLLIFDPYTTCALAVTSYCVGAVLSYLVAQFLGRDAVEVMLARRKPWVRYVTSGFSERPLPTLVLLRVVGLPNNFATYLAAVTGAPISVNVLSAVIGETPIIVITTFWGGSILEALRAGEWSALLRTETFVGALGGLVAIGLILWAQREVRADIASIARRTPAGKAAAKALDVIDPETDAGDGTDAEGDGAEEPGRDVPNDSAIPPVTPGEGRQRPGGDDA